MRVFGEVELRVRFPELGDSSAPVADVQDDDVFVALEVDLPAVDLHGEDGCEVEVVVLVLEDIKGADLGVDEFVAELREEELGVLLPDLVEVLADLGVQTDPQVVVDRELAVLLPADRHLPTVQQVVLARRKVLQQHFSRVYLLLGRSAPA